jgi:hypothetical protein
LVSEIVISIGAGDDMLWTAAAKVMLRLIINTMLIITAHVEYVPPMRFANSLGLLRMVQIENIIADANVNNTDENPKNTPDATVIMQNANAVATGFERILVVNWLYHFVLISNVSLVFGVSIK